MLTMLLLLLLFYLEQYCSVYMQDIYYMLYGNTEAPQKTLFKCDSGALFLQRDVELLAHAAIVSEKYDQIFNV